MAKAKRVLTCQSCGHQTAKWLGKCPDCDAWNSYVEEAVVMPRKGRTASNPQPATLPLPLTEVRRDADERLLTDIGELDRVLGGGIVEGGIGPETEQVIRNIESALALADCTLADVVKTTVWLCNRDDFAAFNEVYGRAFPQD